MAVNQPVSDKNLSISTKWSSFPKLTSCDELNQYMSIRLRGHKKYYHYTSLRAANSILGESGYFLFSNVKRFNDKYDMNQFGDDKDNSFAICFSTGITENVSLWYLYSGIDGNGCRLGLTYNNLNKLIRTASFILCEYDYDKHTIIRTIPVLDGI